MTDRISFSIKEAAALCGLSRTTLYELIRAGELKPAKVGLRTLILRTDLEAMLQRAAA